MATTLKGRKAGGTGSLKAGKDGVTYSEKYIYTVISNTQTESYWNVINTAGLPSVLSTTLGGLTCVGLDAIQDTRSPYVWTVTADFDAETTGQETGNNPDPKTWVPVWSGMLQTYDEVLMEDESSPRKPYINSAKCKFPEPLVTKKPIIVMEFVQYESPTLSLDTIADRNEITNSVAFKGFPIDTLKLNVKGFTKGYYFGYAVTKIDYVIAYKKNKWLNRPLDMGYEYLPTAGSTERVISDKIVSLNTNGTKKADTAAPVPLEFRDCRAVAFAGFLR
jgi:hypothetical protein